MAHECCLKSRALRLELLDHLLYFSRPVRAAFTDRPTDLLKGIKIEVFILQSFIFFQGIEFFNNAAESNFSGLVVGRWRIVFKLVYNFSLHLKTIT